ncbi:MAG: hypothetical protein Q4B60_07560 [Erysipelotrichaceae bacterium]|nr:hypothetical protein [Erysipelotrichaceae bacterium]
MAKQVVQHKVSDINDRSVIYNGKNYFYYDSITKKGYLLQNRNALTYNRYSLRYLFGLLIGIMVFYIFNNPVYGLVSGLLVYGVIEVMFRVKFLPTLTEMENLGEVKKDSYVEYLAKSMERKSLVLSVIFGLIMFFLLPLRGIATNYTGLAKIVNDLIAYGFTVYAILCLLAIFKQKKNEKK